MWPAVQPSEAKECQWLRVQASTICNIATYGQRVTAQCQIASTLIIVFPCYTCDMLLSHCLPLAL